MILAPALAIALIAGSAGADTKPVKPAKFKVQSATHTKNGPLVVTVVNVGESPGVAEVTAKFSVQECVKFNSPKDPAELKTCVQYKWVEKGTTKSKSESLQEAKTGTLNFKVPTNGGVAFVSVSPAPSRNQVKVQLEADIPTPK